MTDSGQSDIDSTTGRSMEQVIADAQSIQGELDAMRTISDALEPLYDAQVRRVLEWLVARHLELPSANLDHVIDGAP
jgi:hypothetical protein